MTQHEHRRGWPTSTGTHRHDERRNTAVDQLLIALDVGQRARRRWRWPTRCAASVGGFKIGSRLFTAEGPVDRAHARRARRPRLPRPEVPRHPQHGRERRRRGGHRSACGWSTCTPPAARAMMQAARDAAHETAARAERAAARHRRHGADQHERDGAGGDRRRHRRCSTRSLRLARAGAGGRARRRRRLAAGDRRDPRALRRRLRDRDAGHPRRRRGGRERTIRSGR